MKKEALSIMTVKTLLAVVIFTGIGTVIIGGGYIIWEYSKITNGNKTIQPISSDQELIHLQKSFNISIADSDYKIVEKNNLHLIKISGHGFYEYRHKEKPVLPARTIQLRIPSNATINSVFIKGSNPVDLSVFNIPALNPKYDKYDYKSELREPFYIEMPASIGLFDPINNPTWFDGGRGITAKTVSVDVIPVIVNAKTKNVVFYKDLIVTVYYETEQKGILDYIFSNKGSRLVRKFYDIDEEVLVFTVIENITKDKASFNIHGKITTTTKEEVASVNKHVIINPEDTAEVKLNFGKIDIPGAYFLKIDAYDSTGKIGVIERPFSVRPNKYRNEESGFEFQYPEGWIERNIEDVYFDIQLRKNISFDHPKRFTEINIKMNKNSESLSLEEIIFDFEDSGRIYEQKEYITINDKKVFKAEIVNWGMVSGKQFLIVREKYWYDIVVDGTNVEDIEIDQILSSFKFTEK